MANVITAWRGAKGQLPAGPFALNQASPQAQGLKMWWPLTAWSRFCNLVPGTPMGSAVNGASVLPQNAIGSAARINFASSQYVDGGNPASAQITGPITLCATICVYSIPESNSEVALVTRDNNTTRGVKFTVANVSGHPELSGLRLEVNGGPLVVEGIAAATNPITPYLAMATYTPSTQISLYRDGRFLNTNTSAIPSALGDPVGEPWAIGRLGYPGFPFYFDGAIQDVRIYNRAMSAAEAWEVYANRWDLYWVPSRRAYFDVGSSGIIAAILAATGTGALAGIGAAYATSLLTSTGLGTLAGTGASRADSTFTSTGSGVLASEGAAIVASLLTAIGQGTLSGVGASTFASTLTSTGTGTFVPSYASFIEAAFGITGAGALAGTGNSLVDSVASMTGAGTLAGAGASLAQAIYTALGTGTCTLVGRATASGHYVISAVGTALWRGNDANINIPLCVIMSDTTTGRPKFVGLGLLPRMAGDGSVPSFVQTASGTPDLSAIIHSIPLIETITACP